MKETSSMKYIYTQVHKSLKKTEHREQSTVHNKFYIT